MVVHCASIKHQHLGVLGIHSHDPFGSKDGIWGDDQLRERWGRGGGKNALSPSNK